MYYVYVLKSISLRELYIGQTNDLKRRFAEHNEKKNISTKHKAPFKLVYYEAYQSRSDAVYREKQLKRHSQAYVALKDRIKNSIRWFLSEGPLAPHPNWHDTFFVVYWKW